MFYVLHDTTVASVTAGFTPFQPSRWAPGQIVHFSTEAGSLLNGKGSAILAGLSGDAWQIEILTSSVSGEFRSPSNPGMIVRLLKRRQVDDALTAAIRSYATRISRFESEREEHPQRRGAA